MADLDELAGRPQAIDQMTHYPPPDHPEQAIARDVMSLFTSPITQAADTSKRAQESMATWAEGGKYNPRPLGEAAMMATPSNVGRAGMGLAMSLLPGEASAETRKERSEREAKQKADQTRLEAEQKLKEISARSEAAKTEAQEQARLAKEAEQRHAQAAAEEEQHKLDMSFREKHPLLSQMFTGAGWTASLMLPYVTRVLNTRASNAFVKEVQGIATDANSAIASGDLKKAATLVNQLAIKEKQAKSLDKDGKLSKMLTGTAMMAPIELGAAPEEMDLMFGTPKAKERAKEELMPTSNPMRLPLSLAQGVSLGSIGSKAPTQRRLPVPEGAATAARKSLTEVKKLAAPTKAPAEPKPKAAPKLKGRKLKVIEGDKSE